MKKRVLSMLLALVMILSITMPTYAAGAEDWTLDCFEIEGTTINGLTAQGIALLETNTEVVLPTTNADGDAITAIGANAFATQPITAITFPETITEIGAAAFRATALTKVVLPDSVTTLGSGAFTNISTLTEVTLSKGLTEIAQSAFNFTGIKKVVIPEGVTKVGRMAFRNAPITSLTLPSTVEVIDKQAFDGNQLSEIVIPDSVTEIGQSAFSQNVEGEGLAPRLTKLTLGKGVKKIGKQAFEKSLLTEVVIPEGLEKLDANTFKNGQAGVVKVYTTNYDHFTSLAASTYHIISYIGDWTEDCFTMDGTTITGLSEKGKAVAENNKELVIPVTVGESKVTAIGEGAFADLELTSLTLPESIESIAKNAFAGNKLKAVALPTTIKSVDADAFARHELVVELTVTTEDSYNSLKDIIFDGAVLVDKTPSEDEGTTPEGEEGTTSDDEDSVIVDDDEDTQEDEEGAPETGDTAPVMLLSVVMLMALASITTILYKKRSL